MNAVGFGGRAVFGWPVVGLACLVLAIGLTIAGAPASVSAQSLPVISIFSGNNQVGTIGSPLPSPLVARVTTFGKPIAGITVTWTITSGTGQLTSPTSVTNSNGDASNTLTPTSAAVSVTASIQGSSVTFTERANPPFDYSLSNSGGVTVIAGASGASTINATLTSGATQPVGFSVSGLPSGA